MGRGARFAELRSNPDDRLPPATIGREVSGIRPIFLSPFGADPIQVNR